MRKCLKTFYTMIVTHATRPNTSKGNIILNKLKNNIIKSHATRNCVLNYKLLLVTIMTKIIKTQRSIVKINIVNHLVNFCVSFYGHNRTKDFLLHHQHLIVRINDHCRHDLVMTSIFFSLIRRIYFDDSCTLLLCIF